MHHVLSIADERFKWNRLAHRGNLASRRAIEAWSADPWKNRASRLPYRRTAHRDKVSVERVDIRLEDTPSSQTGPPLRMAADLVSPVPIGKLQRTTWKKKTYCVIKLNVGYNYVIIRNLFSNCLNNKIIFLIGICIFYYFNFKTE